jgi:RHS repeat-associated protein
MIANKIDAGYRYGFSGHEKDDEIKGSGNSYDMGARMYDPRIGRTPSRDPKAAMYPDISPYAYALNTPIQAKDPDGNVVIFVNGFWGTGTGASNGGTAKHWGANWIKRAQKAIGDNQARFYDGSSDWTGKVGGTSRISWNFDAKNRYRSGYMQGVRDASDIVNSLETDEHGNITESIKFVTSSMGTAYSRGMSQAIVDYVATQNKEIDAYNASLEKNADGSYVDASLVKKHLNVVIESTTDLDAFQASQVGANPNSDNNYYMKSGGILGGDVSGSTEIGNTNMGGHHPSWAPAEDLPKGKMNPSTSGTKENKDEKELNNSRFMFRNWYFPSVYFDRNFSPYFV